MTNIVALECSACGKKYGAAVEQHLCTCGKPLLARYDLRQAAARLTLENLKTRPRTLWRYAEVLPNDPPVSLGEGMTALVHAKRLGASIRCGPGGKEGRGGEGGLKSLYIKDEGLNPTGSVKTRGITGGVSRAKQPCAEAVAGPPAGQCAGRARGVAPGCGDSLGHSITL